MERPGRGGKRKRRGGGRRLPAPGRRPRRDHAHHALARPGAARGECRGRGGRCQGRIAAREVGVRGAGAGRRPADDGESHTARGSKGDSGPAWTSSIRVGSRSGSAAGAGGRSGGTNPCAPAYRPKPTTDSGFFGGDNWENAGSWITSRNWGPPPT